MRRGDDSDRRAKLVVECQSKHHDLPEKQKNDCMKAQLLKTVGVPLIYVRQVSGSEGTVYRFYTPDEKEEVSINWTCPTPREMKNLKVFFKKFCL